jgi:hypothetical protein
VSFIEDENLVTIASGSEYGTLAQVTGVIDAIVAGGVNLNDIKRSAAIARKLNARRAHTTRRIGRPFDAIETASKNTGGCSLSTSTRPAEEVGVIDPVGAQCCA